MGVAKQNTEKAETLLSQMQESWGRYQGKRAGERIGLADVRTGLMKQGRSRYIMKKINFGKAAQGDDADVDDGKHKPPVAIDQDVSDFVVRNFIDDADRRLTTSMLVAEVPGIPEDQAQEMLEDTA